jgi:xanthine dehydrogenase YagT iron-sulfur-binding subunit
MRQEPEREEHSSAPDSAETEAPENTNVEDDPPYFLSEDGEARRRFLRQVLLTGGGLAAANLILDYCVIASDKTGAAPNGAYAQTIKPGAMSVTLRVNGKTYPLQIEPQVTLLDALRERIGLTGSKKGCDRGQCGACTVLADGHRINSCLALAAAYEGAEITTIEGLAEGNQLSRLQEAFINHDGFQCGYCTPGQIMSAAGLLKEGCPVGMTVQECMSGNICRCGAYNGIIAAIEEVRGKRA